jgi:hypothetical protein
MEKNLDLELQYQEQKPKAEIYNKDKMKNSNQIIQTEGSEC